MPPEIEEVVASQSEDFYRRFGHLDDEVSSLKGDFARLSAVVDSQSAVLGRIESRLEQYASATEQRFQQQSQPWPTILTSSVAVITVILTLVYGWNSDIRGDHARTIADVRQDVERESQRLHGDVDTLVTATRDLGQIARDTLVSSTRDVALHDERIKALGNKLDTEITRRQDTERFLLKAIDTNSNLIESRHKEALTYSDRNRERVAGELSTQATLAGKATTVALAAIEQRLSAIESSRFTEVRGMELERRMGEVERRLVSLIGHGGGLD